MSKKGRPSLYTEEIAEEILKRLSAGESLRAICRDAHLPAAPTVHGWVAEGGKFAERYVRAREDGAEHWAEEILDISDKPCADAVEVQQAKLRVDTRKWLLSKLLPKKYGDATRLTHEGDPEKPLKFVLVKKG